MRVIGNLKEIGGMLSGKSGWNLNGSRSRRFDTAFRRLTPRSRPRRRRPHAAPGGGHLTSPPLCSTSVMQDYADCGYRRAGPRIPRISVLKTWAPADTDKRDWQSGAADGPLPLAGLLISVARKKEHAKCIKKKIREYANGVPYFYNFLGQ
jgi:hypothetical protein